MKANLIKKTLIAAAVVATFGMSSAQASDSVTVTVNATIVGVCKFNSNTATLNIKNTGASGSNIDPSLATNATGAVDILYRCSNGTSPSFVVPSSATVTSGTATMTPAITYTGGGAGTGMGSAEAKTLAVTGTILPTAFQNAAAGAYTGSFSITVTP